MSEPSLSIPSSTFDYHQLLPAPEGPPPRPRYWVHVLLLLATCFTTLVVGARLEFNFLHNLPPFTAGNELLPFFPVGWALAQPSRLLLGVPFSAALLIILLSHEMGHYLLCRYYGVRATLPFFIPDVVASLEVGGEVQFLFFEPSQEQVNGSSLSDDINL